MGPGLRYRLALSPKFEVLCSPETSVLIYRTTRRHNPEVTTPNTTYKSWVTTFYFRH